MIATPENLSPAEIRAVFRRNRAAMSQLARDTGIRRQRFSDWMMRRYRKPNAEIESAIRQRAAELINAERAKARRGQA